MGFILWVIAVVLVVVGIVQLIQGQAALFDNDRIAATYASAFEDDPTFSWFFPKASTRRRRLQGFPRCARTCVVNGQHAISTPPIVLVSGRS